MRTRVKKLHGSWYVECDCGLIARRVSWPSAMFRAHEHRMLRHTPRRRFDFDDSPPPQEVPC